MKIAFYHFCWRTSSLLILTTGEHMYQNSRILRLTKTKNAYDSRVNACSYLLVLLFILSFQQNDDHHITKTNIQCKLGSCQYSCIKMNVVTLFEQWHTPSASQMQQLQCQYVWLRSFNLIAIPRWRKRNVETTYWISDSW